MDRLFGRGRQRAGPAARPLPDAASARAGPRAPGRRARPALDRLHQLDPAGARALVPRRRGHRAPDPRVHPVERGHHGLPGEPARHGRRRAHRHLRLGRLALRGRLQPLLPRQGPRRGRRPGLLPGPRRARHLLPRLPRGPADRGAPRRLPPGAQPHPGPALVPAPAADAGLLGVPDRVDGPRPDLGDLPGPVQQVHVQPRPRGHLALARVGLPRRRRDGRAGVARRAVHRRPRGAGQPHLRHQLQPAAARRPGARQRQDHPGARGHLPRRRLERHQGDLGPRLGPAAGPGRRRRAGQQDEHHPGRPVPDLLGRVRRVHPRELLRRRRAAAQDGRRHGRRPAAAALPRRPRLPQGLRGVQGAPRARRPADRDPRAHRQGLDPRQGLRGPQRHAPDEEAHQGRAQGVPRPAAPADHATSSSPPTCRRTSTRARTRTRCSTSRSGARPSAATCPPA